MLKKSLKVKLHIFITSAFYGGYLHVQSNLIPRDKNFSSFQVVGLGAVAEK